MVLAWISTYLIHSYCLMCLVSFGISFMLLFYTWLVRKRFGVKGIAENVKSDIAYLWEKKKQSLAVFLPFALGIVPVLIFFPVYWSFEPPEISAYIPHGMTDDGHPWIGAENPKLEIIEFTDYECFQCNKMHYFLRQTMAKYPGKIRVIHRHFPMDQKVNPLVKTPIHIGSGQLAMLSIYAATQNKFWQMSDILFSIARVKPKIDIRELAQQVGLDENKLARAPWSREIRRLLAKDILDGIKIGVRGTPSFVIDGKVYQGKIPPEIIKKALD
jgi:protein-disulfide isomerase